MNLTAGREFSLSHDQGGRENFLVQGYVLWPITRALLEWLTQMHLTYSQMPVQEQAGQAGVVAPFALGLLLCGFCLVTSIHSTSVHMSRTHAGSLALPPQLKVPPLNKTSVLEAGRQPAASVMVSASSADVCPLWHSCLDGKMKDRKQRNFAHYRMHLVTAKEF